MYVTHGFGGNYNRFAGSIAATWSAMAAKQMPPLIWVFLDQSTPTGTHEFADSVNNGPWGTALTEELIPALERQYKMDGNAKGRFLNGHSSGGWATLWLQTRYPKLFGGTGPPRPIRATSTTSPGRICTRPMPTSTGARTAASSR